MEVLHMTININNTYFGFTDKMSPMQAARVEQSLDKLIRYNDEIMTKKEWIYKRLKSGVKPCYEENYSYFSSKTKTMTRPKTLYKLEWQEINHRGNLDTIFHEINKTEYDYACYLVENGFLDASTAQEYITDEQEQKEAEKQAQALQEKREREERERVQQEENEFNEWLRKQALNYNNDRNIKIAQAEFIKDHGRENPRVTLLLVLIDNIDNPKCKERLKEWLHYRNKTSKKVFHLVTGIKLPNTDKETMALLDTITKSDYMVAV